MLNNSVSSSQSQKLTPKESPFFRGFVIGIAVGFVLAIIDGTVLDNYCYSLVEKNLSAWMTQ